jgi:hypothetical protein
MRHSIPPPASASWKVNTPDSSVATKEESLMERLVERLVDSLMEWRLGTAIMTEG